MEDVASKRIALAGKTGVAAAVRWLKKYWRDSIVEKDSPSLAFVYLDQDAKNAWDEDDATRARNSMVRLSEETEDGKRFLVVVFDSLDPAMQAMLDGMEGALKAAGKTAGSSFLGTVSLRSYTINPIDLLPLTQIQ